MTALLDRAIATVRTLSPARQDEFAHVLLQLAGEDGPVYHLTPEERADLAAADEEIERGEFATDEEVEALWAKYRV